MSTILQDFHDLFCQLETAVIAPFQCIPLCRQWNSAPSQRVLCQIIGYLSPPLCLMSQVPLPVFQALKAFHLAAMAFSTYSFHHQVSQCQQWGWIVPLTTSVVLSRPVLMLFQISSVAATPADALTCKLKTSWKWLLVWGSFSFQTLRQWVNLGLDFSGTSILMSHTRSWCCRATSLPGITFTSLTGLLMVLQKKMVYLYGYVSWLVRDEMAVTFLETCSQEACWMLRHL